MARRIAGATLRVGAASRRSDASRRSFPDARKTMQRSMRMLREGRPSPDLVALGRRAARRPVRKLTTPPIPVVVANPVRLLRAGFRALLQAEAAIAVAG